MIRGMSCRHDLALTTCTECYPDTGTVVPTGPGDSLDGPGAEPEDIGSIAELNNQGDTKYTWNRKNPRECEAAHEHFNAMKAKGFLIFKVKPFGRRSKQPTENFDPKDGGYVYVESKTKSTPYREPAEVAKTFDPKDDYVVTPPVRGG